MSKVDEINLQVNYYLKEHNGRPTFKFFQETKEVVSTSKIIIMSMIGTTEGTICGNVNEIVIKLVRLRLNKLCTMRVCVKRIIVDRSHNFAYHLFSAIHMTVQFKCKP